MPPPPPDPDTERFLQDSLEPGEVVRWSGAPVPLRLVRRVLPASAVALVFIGALGAMVFQGRAPGAPPPLRLLVFSPVLLVLLGLPAWTHFAARRTIYAVTSRRALIAEPQLFGGPRIRSFAPPFPAVEAGGRRPDGGGDLIFGAVSVRGRRGTRRQPIGFYGAADLGAAERALRALPAAPAAPSDAAAAAPVALSTTASRMTGAVFGLLGAGLIFWGAQTVRLAYCSVRWPTATATILSSRVRASRGQRRTSYRPDIRYEYEVEGRAYPGSRVAFGGPWEHDAAAQAVRRYPPGADVPVSYDPAEPARSVLEPGAGAGVWVNPGSGLLLLALAGFFLRAAPRGRRVA
ncbi:MAG TPA: DUF3592 domain-containing protein [Opitutaceae bacterium]|nr:DUF3592 domain-containing protein [Opitutaceae bacterium]